MTAGLAGLWTHFADTSCGEYSPLYDRICRTVAGDEDLLRLVASAPPEGHLPNVLLAAVHFLVLSGVDHELAAVYAGESGADPGPLFVDLCLAHRDRVLDLLSTRHTNTNEPGRSALLGPALTHVASLLGEPLGLVDVGCSAGLNLLCDRYFLDYGAAGSTGPRSAPVRVACEVVGGHPPIAPALPHIAARIGLDLDPIDANDPDEARWLLACVSPDTGRLARTRHALEEARQAPLDLVEGDAVDEVDAVLHRVPGDCVAVVMTTWALAYLTPERRVAFREALAAESAHRTIAWISAEGPGVVDLMSHVLTAPDPQGMEPSVFGLVVFRDGEHDARLLGLVHPHGAWIDWRA